jgi:hypothetical protein
MSIRLPLRHCRTCGSVAWTWAEATRWDRDGHRCPPLNMAAPQFPKEARR